MDPITQKINACREAMQKVMQRSERILELHKKLNEKDELQNELQEDHLAIDEPFYQESIFEELM